MAILIPADGNLPLRDVTPKNGRNFHLAELYELLACDYVEVLQLADGRKMVLDEDGKLANKPRNERATRLANFVSPKQLISDMLRIRESGIDVIWMGEPITDNTTEVDSIVGDVLIAIENEVL